jgi:hypothetical protein
MAKKNKNQQAKKMASAGKSAAQVKAKTGVGSQTAQRYVAKQAPAPRPSPAPKPAPKPAPAPAPRFSGQVTGAARAAQSAQVQQTLSTPQVGQRLPQDATVYAPGVTPPAQPAPTPSKKKEKTPSKPNPEIKGVNQGLRIAGENGISKNELKKISQATGKEPEKIVNKLDKLNTKLEGKDKAGIGLKSGTANMLVKEAQKSPPKYRGFGADSKDTRFGEGAISSTLQSMISTPANAGTMIKGQRVGGKEADPGFNPGGSPDKNRMIGGTVIRPSGNIAVKGAGEQYEKKSKDEDDTPRFEGQLKGAARDAQSAKVNEILSNPQIGQRPGEVATIYGPGVTPGTAPEPIIEDTPITPEIPEPEEEVDRSASSGAGGLDLASWATGFRRARSARQKSGRSAQGLASQKKNPFKSWAS